MAAAKSSSAARSMQYSQAVREIPGGAAGAGMESPVRPPESTGTLARIWYVAIPNPSVAIAR